MLFAKRHILLQGGMLFTKRHTPLRRSSSLRCPKVQYFPDIFLPKIGKITKMSDPKKITRSKKKCSKFFSVNRKLIINSDVYHFHFLFSFYFLLSLFTENLQEKQVFFFFAFFRIFH